MLAIMRTSIRIHDRHDTHYNTTVYVSEGIAIIISFIAIIIKLCMQFNIYVCTSAHGRMKLSGNRYEGVCHGISTIRIRIGTSTKLTLVLIGLG
jgi:hypothetical protein